MRPPTNLQLQITVGATILTATLYNNPTTHDFIALLPLNLTLEDYAGTEKISDLPRRLSTASAPAGSDPEVGDLTYYAPWGNLALFYKDYGYAKGLIILGRITAGMEALQVPGAVQVRLELLP